MGGKGGHDGAGKRGTWGGKGKGERADMGRVGEGERGGILTASTASDQPTASRDDGSLRVAASPADK